jgi:1-acyl-sn-glycerol-3-phosphate acyltransferase
MDDTTPQATKTWFYQFARYLCILLSALLYPCRLINPDAIPREAPFILIANHQSMMDPLLLAAKFKQHEIHFIGKRELTNFKPLKWVVERLHMIAVTRHMSDLSAMRAALKTLKQGHVLGIFPEGTRRHGKPMASIETGVSMLAFRSGVPLLPVLIFGRPSPFHRTEMLVGSHIHYQDLSADGLDKEAGATLNMRIQAHFDVLMNKIQVKNKI